MRRFGLAAALIAVGALALVLLRTCETPAPSVPAPSAAEGRAPASEEPRTASPRARRPTEPVEAEEPTRPAAAVAPDGVAHRLEIRTSSGGPASTARVVSVVRDDSAVGAEEWVADADGRVGLTEFEADAWTLFRVEHGAEAALFRRADGATTRVELRRAAVVRGVVEDSRGAPVAGARCRLDWHEDPAGTVPHELLWSPELETTADARGGFAFPPAPVPAGVGAVRVRAAAAGFRDGVAVQEPPDGGELRVRLVRRLHVRGRCVSSDGEPLHNAEVRAVGAAQPVFTWEDGTFLLRDVAPEDLPLAVDHEHALPVEVPVDATEGEVDVGRIVLPHGETVRGRVRFSDGAPAKDAVVRVELGFHGVRRTARTAADGRFHLRGLPEGAWTLVATHDEDGGTPRTARTGGVRAGSLGAELVFAPGRHVRFRFRLEGDGEYFAEVRDLRVEARHESGDVRTLARREGAPRAARPAFELPAAGVYRFDVAVPGHEPVVVEGVLVADGVPADVDVVLRPATLR